jgi:hypothetical protein
LSISTSKTTSPNNYCRMLGWISSFNGFMKEYFNIIIRSRKCNSRKSTNLTTTTLHTSISFSMLKLVEGCCVRLQPVVMYENIWSLHPFPSLFLTAWFM